MHLFRTSNPSCRAAAAIALSAAAVLGSVTVANTASARSEAVYTAQLEQPMDSEIIVAGGVAWTCGGTSCTAYKSRSRPEIMCRKLVRETGAVTAFAFKDRTLTAAQIAKCNG